jgi:hypothetical protein
VSDGDADDEDDATVLEETKPVRSNNEDEEEGVSEEDDDEEDKDAEEDEGGEDCRGGVRGNAEGELGGRGATRKSAVAAATPSLPIASEGTGEGVSAGEDGAEPSWVSEEESGRRATVGT